jgi:hypothetical protein
MSVIIDGSAGVTTNTGAVYNGIQSLTVNAGGTTPFPSSSGPTAVDFTSIPSWVKRITVMFSGVSTSGTSLPQIQLGAGSVTTSGYAAASANNASASSATVVATSGFIINSANAANTLSGLFVISLLGNNAWTLFGAVAASANQYSSSGGVTLGGTLDRVRITTVNGTDTFDAGSINILYE